MPKVVRVIARLNVGGPAIHTILLSQRLRPRFQTTLVSGMEAPAEGNMLPLAERLCVPVTRIPELGREINPVGDLVALIKLSYLIWRERPEVVHTHTAKAGMVGRLAAYICRTPVVVHTFHGHVFRGGYFGPRKTRLFLTVERLLARITDRIVTVNEQQRRELLDLRIGRPEQMLAIPLGLELGELAEGSPDAGPMRAKWGVASEAKLIGIVARLVPVKGHELFLDAAKLLHDRHPDWRFAVIGDGERRGELEAYARAMALPVVFTGWETDLPAVYSALDAVCLTSLNEGSPVALIEALAAGKPVISTPAGGVTDLIQDGVNGRLVDSRDPPAFAHVVEEVLEDDEMAQSLAARGRASVYPRYDIGRLAEDIGALYDELLREKNHETRDQR